MIEILTNMKSDIQIFAFDGYAKTKNKFLDISSVKLHFVIWKKKMFLHYAINNIKLKSFLSYISPLKI